MLFEGNEWSLQNCALWRGRPVARPIVGVPNCVECVVSIFNSVDLGFRRIYKRNIDYSPRDLLGL